MPRDGQGECKMCISVFSTAHPHYTFVLISNRDEFVSRPTARAAWWDPPHAYVLGGRDLQREEHGTWLGITKQGRLAVLTNFREEGVEVNRDKSRGGVVNSYLTVPPDSDEDEEGFVRRVLEEVGIYDVGGFTLLFGKLQAPAIRSGLAVISNRTASAQGLTRIAAYPGETHGLSNSHYGDTSWPKVATGERLLAEVIHAHHQSQHSQAALISRLFDILNVDSLPRRKQGEDWVEYVRHMKNSILVPAIKGQPIQTQSAQDVASAQGTKAHGKAEVKVDRGAYGTQKQTVLLVDLTGKVTFVERTLYDETGRPLADEDKDEMFEFEIEGWDT